MKQANVIQEKSYSFAVRMIKTYRLLVKKSEYILSKQVLRSATSIGANIEEAIGAQSKRDFFMKLTIAYKEARETHYWLRLLRDTQYLEAKLAQSLLVDCEEILKIIGSIQTSIKQTNS